MAQHRHKKWLYGIAILLVIASFLGVPQMAKTVITVVLALFVAYIAFMLPDRKQNNISEQPSYVENRSAHGAAVGANTATPSWEQEKEAEE